ncbi:MAG: sulfatase-like hydrolase/transferase [Planctomycetes bacterium]|nr:sulfatase-like hydrolase/transferase [Planctomycetota bacterium]
MSSSLLSIVVWSLALVSTFAEARAERPNVLLIISDDQHWTDFGFMGSEVVATPHLDELASRGLVFPRGYVAAPLCRPSLATLATGLHPHQHKITGNDPPKGTNRAEMLRHIDAAVTLPSLLGAAGYRTMQTGKWWEGAATRGGFTEGMTHGSPAHGGRHGDRGLTIGRVRMSPATDFIDSAEEAGDPWFLWYAPFLPHTPHNPPEELLERYRKEGVPLPVAKYRAMCTWFDQTCGDLLGYLDAKGLRKDTLVVLVTDNGWIQRTDGNGYAPRSKRTAYEGGVRTPIVLQGPGIERAERREVPVSSVDIPATILAACGVEVPEAWPGHDLRLVRSEGEHARGPVFGAAYTHDVVDLDAPARSLVTRFVVDGGWKLLAHEDSSEGTAGFELFHLAEDPAESRPVEEPERRAALLALLDGWWRPQ